MIKKYLIPFFVVIPLSFYLYIDHTFWLRWFKQPDDNEVLTSWQWYSPIEVIENRELIPLSITKSDNRTISDDTLESAVEYAKSFNSLALLISRNESLELEYYKEGYNRNTIIDSQSMHKGILGIATVIALDKNLIPSIDTRVSDYIPEWKGDKRQEITIGNLLYMTSGLKQIEYNKSPFSLGQRLFFGENIFSLVENIGYAFEPGSSFDFNHINSQALHSVLTKSSGRRYSEFLRENLWKPLSGSFAQVRLDRKGGDARVFCCIQTKAMDWIRIGSMLANNGKLDGVQVISEKWINIMLRGSNTNPNFAMHIWRGSPFSGGRLLSKPSGRIIPVSSPYLKEDVFFIEGRGGQRLYFIPSERLSIYRSGEINFAWDDAYFINLILNGVDNK